MNRIIIESPYAGDIEKNVEYARKCIKDSLSKNEAPLASHLLYTQPGILNDRIPHERKKGIEAGYAYYDIVDYIVFYTDLGISSGMEKALERANEMSVKIKFRKLK
jgi:hypothetical protein